MIKAIKLKRVTIPNNIILAPLAGYTDAAMRRMCRECGAGLVFTEMVSAKGLLYGNKNTSELLLTTPPETPSAAQIFGSEPEVFSEVIANNEQLSRFDIIDINMGCPVRKIVSSGEGSALLMNITRAAKIVEFSAKSTTKPITVKIRIPDKSANLTLIEAIKILTDSGAAMITVHGRTAKMMYSGKSDRDEVFKAAQTAKIPIIYNGDIQTPEDAKTALAGPVAGIMIGRGAIGNPTIFHQIQTALSTTTTPNINPNINLQTNPNINPNINLQTNPNINSQTNPTTTPNINSNINIQTNPNINPLPEYCSTLKGTILKHIEYMLSNSGERYTLVNMRKHLGYYVKGKPQMREFKTKVNTASDTKTLIALINQHLD